MKKRKRANHMATTPGHEYQPIQIKCEACNMSAFIDCMRTADHKIFDCDKLVVYDMIGCRTVEALQELPIEDCTLGSLTKILDSKHSLAFLDQLIAKLGLVKMAHSHHHAEKAKINLAKAVDLLQQYWLYIDAVAALQEIADIPTSTITGAFLCSVAYCSLSFCACFVDDEGSAVWQQVERNAVPVGRCVVTMLDVMMPVPGALQSDEQGGNSSGEGHPLSGLNPSPLGMVEDSMDMD